MELGRVKDQINTVVDRMETVDPVSEEYEVLSKRLNELRKIVQDEEERRARDEREAKNVIAENTRHEEDISERKKDRIAKIALGVGAGFIGVLSIFADETRVMCKSGLETIDKMRKLVH